MSRAAKVIAISESTKTDLIEIFDVDASKIEVIYLASALVNDPASEASISCPEKYLLFVGRRGGYKNFATFFEAAIELLKNDSDLYIVCAGGGRFTSAEVGLFNSTGLASRIVQYDISDSTLAQLYRSAQCFVFPSLYEGFGIPVLEAFSCGCPLLCSNVSSLPEIAGGAALLFDPHSPESIYAALTQVLNSASLQQQLRDAGHLREKQFSWEKTARDTKKLYQNVVAASGSER